MRPGAPPHTRGSTRIHRGWRWYSVGSPAHAGIDPPQASGRTPAAGLPRTRGDRPMWASLSLAIAKAPPHTRGSTLWGLLVLRLSHGSPAHAGIDPRVMVRYLERLGLPRTRGDRPHASQDRDRPVVAPPHTRGSTHPDQWCPDLAGGSPAHAGIDPQQATTTLAWSWLPRTRGDRPTWASCNLAIA